MDSAASLPLGGDREAKEIREEHTAVANLIVEAPTIAQKEPCILRPSGSMRAIQARPKATRTRAGTTATVAEDRQMVTNTSNQ